MPTMVVKKYKSIAFVLALEILIMFAAVNLAVYGDSQSEWFSPFALARSLLPNADETAISLAITVAGIVLWIVLIQVSVLFWLFTFAFAALAALLTYNSYLNAGNDAGSAFVVAICVGAFVLALNLIARRHAQIDMSV